MDSSPPKDIAADAAPTSAAILASILECPFRPAAAARRSLHCPLRTAWLIHFVCALGALLVVLVVIAATETDVPADYLDYWSSALNVLGIFLKEVAEYPFHTLAIVLAIELGYAALALWLLPWGACDEPIKESLRHALRRVWIQSPQLLLFFVVAGGATAYLYQSHQEWMHIYGQQRPVYPDPPTGLQPGTPQWDQHNAQVAAFGEEWNRIEREDRLAMPFHLRFGEPIIGVNCFFWAMVFLGSLLRSTGVLRLPRRSDRQPLCEACGYDLTTMPMESRCPECGDAVLASLGADARPGPPWTDRRLVVGTAWFRTCRQALFSPTAFGRSIRVTEPGTSHRVFFLMHLPIVFLIAACTPPAIILAVEGHFPEGEEWAVALFLSPAAGCICVVAATSVMLKSAAWAGWYHWWRLKRNLLPATIQITCYLVPYLLVWEFLGGVSGVIAIVLANHEPFVAWFRGTRTPPDAMLTFAWFALNLLCLAVYANIVNRAVASTRFANR